MASRIRVQVEACDRPCSHEHCGDAALLVTKLPFNVWEQISESNIRNESGMTAHEDGFRVPAEGVAHFREWVVARRDYLGHLGAGNSDEGRPSRLVAHFDALLAKLDEAAK